MTGLPAATLIPAEIAETSMPSTCTTSPVRARTPWSTSVIAVPLIVVAAPVSIPVALPLIRPPMTCRSGLKVRIASLPTPSAAMLRSTTFLVADSATTPSWPPLRASRSAVTSPAPRSTRTPVAESFTVTSFSSISWPPMETPAIDARSIVEPHIISPRVVFSICSPRRAPAIFIRSRVSWPLPTWVYTPMASSVR